MANYYFFQTVQEGSRERLRALPYQLTKRGEEIDPNVNVAVPTGQKAMREVLPIGTIFVSEVIDTTGSFYKAGSIYPIETSSTASHPSVPKYADSNMVLAYENYLKDCKERTSAVAEEKSEDTSFGGIFGDTFGSEEPMKEKPRVARLKKAELRKVATPSRPAMNLVELIKTDKKYAAPSIAKDGFYVEDSKWTILMRNILKKQNTMMIGESGTGKTELAMLAAKRLGLECNVYDMGAMLDPVASLLGTHRLQKGGESVFDYAKFTQDIQKPGVIILDELSRAPLSCLNILFPCLDNRRKLQIDIAGSEDEREIKVHPDCVFIATANIGDQYTGTQMMDRALVDRFFPLELGYMGDDNEVEVLINRCSIDKAAATNIVNVAKSIRVAYSRGDIQTTVSTRWTLSAGHMVADGFSALQALQAIFLPLFEGSLTDGERGIVNKMIMAR